VQFKHELQQVLSPDPHEQSVRFTKPRTQPGCFEYDDTILNMWLDQQSCWY